MVEVVMKALAQDEAARIWGSAGAGKDREHGEIRQCSR